MKTPSDKQLRDMRTALVNQLPELAKRWWTQVRKAASEGNETVLKLKFAEAQNRLDHENARVGKAILRLLANLFGLDTSELKL